MGVQVERCSRLQRAGSHVFDYATTSARRRRSRRQDAFAFPGFVPAYIRRVLRGKGPFRWAALSGDPDDIASPTRRCSTRSRTTDAPPLDEAREGEIAFRLARAICWLGYGQRHRVGLRFNELVRTARSSAIVIGRDHLDCGSVASPNRETEGMKDGTDAVADWAILTRWSHRGGRDLGLVPPGGGVGIGYSLHAGMVIVAEARRAPRAASSVS